MLKKQFEKIWDQLRSKRAKFADFLDEVAIRDLRGIRDLKVVFPYPVTVLAGPNGCGKSTVLFAAGCLYDSADLKEPAGARRRYPGDWFPGFQAKQPEISRDGASGGTILEFAYVERGTRRRMRWARGAKGGWAKSFFGAKGAQRPVRTVYVRTLASFTNPSEVRSLLQMGRSRLDQEPVAAAHLALAHRILPRRYARLNRIASQRRDLMFVELEEGPLYSEFHMSSGERAVLRLAKEISGLRDALVLIDEVDVGLHPFTQQQLMLELQRLALRQNLQMIVTSHSPVILDSVPPEGRIFLERTRDNVVQREAFRDVLERAMYGRPLDRLSVLCEDGVAKAIVQGVTDVLSPQLGLSSGEIDVGHDTGKAEFPQHVRTLAKFHQLEDFLFVLDGDARDLESEVKQAAKDHGQAVKLLFLPGASGPEAWVWERIKLRVELYAKDLGFGEDPLREELRNLERSFEASTDKPSEIAKQRLAILVETPGRTVEETCRIVARREAELPDGELIEFRDALHDAIRDWRSFGGS